MSGTQERGLSDDSDRRARLRRTTDAALRDEVAQLRTEVRTASSVALSNRKLLEDLGVEALSARERALLPAVLQEQDLRTRERAEAREDRASADRRFNRSLAFAAFVVSVITVAAPYVHDLIVTHHP